VPLPPEIPGATVAKSASLQRSLRRTRGIPRDAPDAFVASCRTTPNDLDPNPNAPGGSTAMSRLSELPIADLNDEQRRALDKLRTVIAHNGLGGPFSVWLRMPGIGAAIVDLFVAQRRQGKLEKRLFELMTLVVIRRWSAQFAWWAHGARAQELGIPAQAVEAIRTRRAPQFAREDEKLIYDVTTEIMDKHGLSEASYARAKALLGEAVLVELIFSVGFYNMVGITLSSCDVPTPDNSRPLD
jgi:4-carboxymuconolactone decarboxylase